MATVTSSLQERAQRALSGSPVYALRDLRVEHAGESLTISGRVLSFYHKQLAQEVVRAVTRQFEGARAEVVNIVEVAAAK